MQCEKEKTTQTLLLQSQDQDHVLQDQCPKLTQVQVPMPVIARQVQISTENVSRPDMSHSRVQVQQP